MASIYTNKNAKVSVISGKILSVGEDKKSLTVESQEYLFEKKSRVNKTFDFQLASESMTLGDDVVPGKLVTIMGYEKVNMDMMGMSEEEEESKWIAGYVSVGNESFDFKKISVVNGDVVFARYNDELDANGKPNMKPERMGPDGKLIPSKPRLPHFDIGVSVTDKEGNRVLHIVNEYPSPVKDGEGNVVEGKKNYEKIESLKKRFANFDKESNPMRVTIVTQPGEVYSRPREYNGQTYINNYCNHMGVRSLDIEFLREKTKEAEGEKKEVAEQPEVKEEATPTNTTATEVSTTPAAEVETNEDVNDYFQI